MYQRSSLTTIIPLTLALTVLLGYSFINAQWTNAPANPPSGNVPPPVNVGTATQNKAGVLGVNGLGVFGLAQISSTGPTLRLNDTDAGHSTYAIHVNGSAFHLLADRNNDNILNDAPHPMILYAGPNSTQDFVRFTNQVRANQYCDFNGENCSSGVGGGQSSVTQKIRSLPGNSLPPPPAGLSEWPDYIICDVNTNQKHHPIPFNRVVVQSPNSLVMYALDGAGSASYWFFANGTYQGRSSIVENCTPQSAGSDIGSICAAGYCVFN